QFSQSSAGRVVSAWVPSTCGLCSSGCRVDIGVSDGEIAGVRGRTDHPVNAARLGPKRLNQYYANHHPSRARYPFIRRPNDRRERVSWDEALSLVTQRIAETLATEGPDGVGIYNSGQLLLEEYYTLAKIARAGLG